MTADKNNLIHEVAIIGGGVSGSALLYVLAKYTDIPDIVLIEKYDKTGQVNSRASNNSQTLHVGDIETNYPVEKVRQVKPASMMVARYAQSLPAEERAKILFPVSKMVIAVGKKEVETLAKRFDQISGIFPELQMMNRNKIGEVEPAVVLNRDPAQELLALYNPAGYAIDFENLSQSFADHASASNKTSILYGSPVETIEKNKDQTYALRLKNGKEILARAVIVDADSYSLLMAKQLGYGKNYSLIPIAGTFYFSPKILNGKVYTVQEPKLPFAAVHGDPDVRVPGVTRWGPTARFYPVLESRNFKTSYDYLRSSGLNRPATWLSFFKILLDPVRFRYLLQNMLYELPWVGKRMFLHNARKIAPSIRASDIRVAKGFGGMRLQRVDTDTQELQLGEGKILGENIIFNMTPSPGASVCLFNAMRDAETIMGFLGNKYVFRKKEMEADLVIVPTLDLQKPVSLHKEGYVS